MHDSSEEMHVCKRSAEIFPILLTLYSSVASVHATFVSCTALFFKNDGFFFVAIYLKSVLLQVIEENWRGRVLNC